MSWLSPFWPRNRKANNLSIRTVKQRHGRLLLEQLEDRDLLSTLFVTPPSIPPDTTHFQTVQDALGAAKAGDTIQIASSGTSPGTFNNTFLAATANSGTTTIETFNPIYPGEEIALSDWSGTDPNNKLVAFQYDVVDSLSRLTFDPSVGRDVYIETLKDPLNHTYIATIAAPASAAATGVTDKNGQLTPGYYYVEIALTNAQGETTVSPPTQVPLLYAPGPNPPPPPNAISITAPYKLSTDLPQAGYQGQGDPTGYRIYVSRGNTSGATGPFILQSPAANNGNPNIPLGKDIVLTNVFTGVRDGLQPLTVNTAFTDAQVNTYAVRYYSIATGVAPSLPTIAIDKAITLQGDLTNPAPNVGNGSLLVWQGTQGATISHLNLNLQTSPPYGSSAGNKDTGVLESRGIGTTIRDIIVNSATINGSNEVFQNSLVTGSAFLGGNGKIIDNQFIPLPPSFNFSFFSSALLEVAGIGGIVQGNTFDDVISSSSSTPLNVAAIAVDSFGDTPAGPGVITHDVLIENNTIRLTGGQLATGNLDKPSRNVAGIVVEQIPGKFPFPTPDSNHVVSATIRNNIIDTLGQGDGVFVRIQDGSLTEDGFPGVSALIQGNDLRNNFVGVEVSGDGKGTVTSGGNIDLGGGSTLATASPSSSLGGNNFKGFTAQTAVNNGKFSIYLHGTGNNSGPVSASKNIWSDSNPGGTVKDGFTNRAVGPQPYGDGKVDVGITQLTSDQKFVQTLYNQFLGRTGTIGELDGWVSVLATRGQKAVANGIMRSQEAFKVIVDAYYVQLLHRQADQPGESSFVGYLLNGGTLEGVVSGLMGSGEYLGRVATMTTTSGQQLGHSDIDFVESLYVILLQRDGTSSELSNWVNMIPKIGRSGVALAIAKSVEHRSIEINRYYSTILHRSTPPSSTEVGGWANSSQDLLSIQVTFAGTNEYYVNG